MKLIPRKQDIEQINTVTVENVEVNSDSLKLNLLQNVQLQSPCYYGEYMHIINSIMDVHFTSITYSHTNI